MESHEVSVQSRGLMENFTFLPMEFHGGFGSVILHDRRTATGLHKRTPKHLYVDTYDIHLAAILPVTTSSGHKCCRVSRVVTVSVARIKGMVPRSMTTILHVFCRRPRRHRKRSSCSRSNVG